MMQGVMYTSCHFFFSLKIYANVTTRLQAIHDFVKEDSQKVEEHFNALRTSDLKTAFLALERGINIAAANQGRNKGDYEPAFKQALESAEKGFFLVEDIKQKMQCYEIMCYCFHQLYESDASEMAAISTLTKKLFQAKEIQIVLDSFSSTLSKSGKLSKEDFEIVEDVFEKVCDAIQMCSEGNGWSDPKIREQTRNAFRCHKTILNVTDPSHYEKWTKIEVQRSRLSLFRSAKERDISQYRDILMDLAHSTTKEVYPLGCIRLETETKENKVTIHVIANGSFKISPSLQKILLVLLLVMVACYFGQFKDESSSWPKLPFLPNKENSASSPKFTDARNMLEFIRAEKDRSFLLE
jgi:hypothetical protein